MRKNGYNGYMDEIAKTLTPEPLRLSRRGRLGEGRPSKYRQEYCQQLIDFFSVPATTTIIKKIITKNGTEIEEEVERAVNLPTIERFCSNIGVDGDTIITWNKDYPEFHAAYARAKALQKDLLITNGCKGLYNSQFAIFVAKNVTDMRDKIDIDVVDATIPYSQEERQTLREVLMSRAKRELESARQALPQGNNFQNECVLDPDHQVP